MRDSDSILLIEDENLVAETLKGNFQDNGYRIITARNGEEGLRKFQNENFDLVITDLKLRGMDGLQVSRKIKKINPKTPVIVVTGYPKLVSPNEASRCGVHDFVLKPFTWPDILKKVTDCLDPMVQEKPVSVSRESRPVILPRNKKAPISRLGTQVAKTRKDPYHSLSQFLFGQTRALDMLIRREPLKDILTSLVLEMESCSDQAAGSVHLFDEEKAHLELIAGPNLPRPLSRDIQTLDFKGSIHPWGKAITQNKPIFVEDIRNSSLWAPRHPSTKICGFRASWSFPLRGFDQQAIGVLTFYSRGPRSPSTEELKWILSATRLLGIMVEFASLDKSSRRIKEEREESSSHGEAVLTFNGRGVIDSFNSAAARLFGYEGTSLIGQNIKNLISGKSSTLHGNPFQRIDNGSEEEFGTMKAAAIGLHKEGFRLYLDISVGEMTLQEGRKFVANITDVSKQKFAEKILQDTRGSLEEWNGSVIETSRLDLGERLPERDGREDARSLKEQLVCSEKWAATGKLAASLAHEIKNPLFGILNVLEKAAREFSLKQGSEDLLELAIRECYRVMDLAKKMQDFQRPSSHTVAPMDLNSAVNDMVLLTRARLDKRKIKLVLDLAPALPKVYAIEDQIKQVVLNLLNNAEEAIEGDTGIILIKTRELEQSLQIVVQDNGKGIPQNLQHKIFEPFFSTKKENGGMGLGLPVSFEIIQTHAGRIDIEKGIDDKGASFIITLPKRTSRKGGRAPDNRLTTISSSLS